MELGKTIKRLRLKAGLTQEQLANALSVSPQAVSKWENASSMPDVALLPLLSETLGVSIDDLFDRTTEQRFNRIENRMDIEEELPADVFLEFEAFLQGKREEEEHSLRATELLARLYWDRMNAYSHKVRRYAKIAIEAAPGKKRCQWMLNKAEGHAIWDWNLANHQSAIDFYRDIVTKNPAERLPYYYLIDNLLADSRYQEAQTYLDVLKTLDGANPIMCQTYQAHIALCRYDEKEADRIIEKMLSENPDSDGACFEAAQYYAKKGQYERTVDLYERCFQIDPRRPRYVDALQGIATVEEIRGDYNAAAKAQQRIVDLLKEEWGMSEETELLEAKKELERLEALAKSGH